MALLRLGTSCLDATKVAGLGNETATVSSIEGVVHLGPLGVMSLSLPKKPAGTKLRRKRPVNPFTREIKHVKAVSVDADVWINHAWVRELYRFALSLWRFAKGTWRILRPRNLTKKNEPENIHDLGEHEADPPSRKGEINELYRQFLDGEVITDGESEFETEQMGSSPDSDAESDDESTCDDLDHPRHSEEELEDDKDLDETVGLYSEHGTQRETTPLAPVLLAHLTSPDSPLTRRRYASLIHRRDNVSVLDAYRSPSGVSSAVASGFQTNSSISRHHDRDGDYDINHRLCVVCMCNERIVICWPCR